ncbi:chromate transporter [Clostridia bacterium]|nr:chromate transporter [Clostridia bacterium]
MYLQLFWSFLQIGMFSVGGGYAMIPFLTQTVSENAWLTQSEITDMLAISQMTPGPFYLNTAIFVGMHNAGFPGSLAATGGVIIPSLLIILVIARFFYNFHERVTVQRVLFGVRPAVVGLIAAAAASIARECLLKNGDVNTLTVSFQALAANIDWLSVGIAVFALIIIIKCKIHPLLALALSAAAALIAHFCGYPASL